MCIQIADREFFPEVNKIFDLKFHDKMKVNHKDDRTIV